MTFLRRVPRRVIQLTCFVGAIVLVWPLVPWAMAPRFFQQISPFVAISSSIAARSIGVGAILALVVAVASSFKKRWFCLYLCPTGFLLENTNHLGLRKASFWSKCPPIGRYVAILTLAGSVVGYPVLLWMDPLCIFSSPFALNKATNPFSVILVCLGLGVLVGGTFIFGMLWCVRICPLSGLQDMLFAMRKALWTHLKAGASSQKFSTARRVFFAGARRRVARPWGAPISERRDTAKVTPCCVLPAPCPRIVLPGCASVATTACTPARRKSFTRIQVMRRVWQASQRPSLNSTGTTSIAWKRAMTALRFAPPAR